MEGESGIARAALMVVERGKILAVPSGRREGRMAHARLRHHPGDERARPWPARGAAVPLGMSAACPIAADPTAERLAALVDAVAIGVAVGMAAIDHGRAAEARPFLPGDQRGTIGRRPVGIAEAAAVRATAASEMECYQR